MSQNLSIGILTLSSGWHLLLEQIGLPYREVARIDGLTAEGVAVLIVNREIHRSEREKIEEYRRNGGAVLDAGYFLPTAHPTKFSDGKFRRIIVEPQHPILESLIILDVYATGIYHTERALLEGLLHIDSSDNGPLVFLGLDCHRLMIDEQPRQKQFYGPNGIRPDERVSRVSKGELLLLVQSILQWLYHERKLPFIRKRSFPGDAHTLFSFRIDSDYGSRSQVNMLHRIAEEADIRMTWFLHVGAHEEWLDVFHEFKGHEISLHGYRHKTFKTEDENRANIRKAQELLKRHGFEPSGFAAPNGIWNTSLAQVLKDEEIEYSSEFSLGYDTMPFFPLQTNHSGSEAQYFPTLQIPTHPISIGNLLREKATEEHMIDYYRYVVQMKIARGEPLIFYGHPTHEHWEVTKELFREISAHEPSNLTHEEYATWWKKRVEMNFDASISNGILTVNSQNRDDSVMLEATLPDNSTGIVSDGTISIDDIQSTFTRQAVMRPDDISTVDDYTPRLFRHALFDSIIRMGQ